MTAEPPGEAMISSPCPACGHVQKYHPDLAGKKGRCRACAALFRIGKRPEGKSQESAPAESAPKSRQRTTDRHRAETRRIRIQADDLARSSVKRGIIGIVLLMVGAILAAVHLRTVGPFAEAAMDKMKAETALLRIRQAPPPSDPEAGGGVGDPEDEAKAKLEAGMRCAGGRASAVNAPAASVP